MCLQIRKPRRRRNVVAVPCHTGFDGLMGCGVPVTGRGQSGRCPRTASGKTQCRVHREQLQPTAHWRTEEQITVIKMTNAWVPEQALYVYLRAKEQRYIVTTSIKGLMRRLRGLYGNTRLLRRGCPNCHDSIGYPRISLTGHVI